jgi:hypothetical protein
MLLSNIQSTPFSCKLRKLDDLGATSLQASGALEVLLSKTQRTDSRGDGDEGLFFLT